MKRITSETFNDTTEADAAQTVLRGIARLKEPEREKWVTMLATTAISVMHGTYGREFTESYLHGARLSLDNPGLAAPIEVVEVPERKQ